MNLAVIFDELLRDRAALFARIEKGANLRELARSLIIITAASAAVFGAAIGAYRGGIQVVFASVKLPLILLLTAAICAPTWSALRAAVGAPASLKVDLVRVLGGLAMVGLVLAALAPFLLVGVVVEASYHSMAIILLTCAAVGGIVGVAVLIRSRKAVAMGIPLLFFLSVFVLVGAQMSWTLRPHLVRPRSETTTFIRPLEGSLLESMSRSWSSMKGEYERDHAPLPGQADPWR